MNALELRRRTLGKGVYKKTVEGNPAIAQGSLARRYPGITMQGWTEQAQYEGNQLIDTSLVVETDLVKKSFGKITPKTSAVYMTTIYSDGTTKIASLEPGDYYFYFFSERSFNSPYLEYTENGETKTVNMNTSFSVSSPASVTSIKCGGINVSVEVTYEAQINIGTSALAYEPVYTGGNPSPSPDYPQEIVSAGKYDEASRKYEYEVKLTGANLFDPDGEIVDGSPYDGIPLNNKGIVSMALYEKNPDVDVSNIYFGICSEELNSNDVIWALASGTIQSGGKIISPMNNRYVCWHPGNDATLQKLLSRYDVMVNYGDGVYLPYQPYKEQTVTLTSDRPLTKWDRLEKRAGQWGWVYKSGSYIFDGSTDENWNVTATSKYTFIIDINGAMFKNSYCDRYICEPGSWASYDFGVYSDNGFATKYFRPPSADVETVEQWKTFLSQNPLTVVCETAEETFVPLSESEQEQMNELYTFRPTTVLSNDCDCNMSLTYKTKKSLEVTT